MENHPAFIPVTRLGCGGPIREKQRLPDWIVNKYGIAFVTFPLSDPKQKREELFSCACTVAADIAAGKHPGYRLVSMAVSKTTVTVILMSGVANTTDDKLFSLLARQGVGIGSEEWIVEVTGVLELKDETPDLDTKPSGLWYLPDGCILALPKDMFRDLCLRAGLDPAKGQVQGTILGSSIFGKGMIIESPYEYAVSNVIPVGETRQLDMRDVWVEQRSVGRTGKARPNFFGALSLLAPIDSRYKELIQFLVETVNKKADKVEDLFKFVPANLEDEDEEESTETSGTGIAEFCMASHAPIPESMIVKVRDKSERLLLSRIGDGLRYRKLASGLAFGTPYLPRGIVFKAGAKFSKTFCVRHPFMGVGSVLPVILIGSVDHVDDALSIIGFHGNADHVKHYVSAWRKSRLVHINNLDLLALLGDSDGDALHVFGTWTGDYRPVDGIDYVVAGTKLRQVKGTGIDGITDVNERIGRMAYRATKGEIGLFDGPAMNTAYAALMLLNKRSITLNEYVSVLNNAMLTKHLFGVVGVKHRIKDLATGDYLSPEQGLEQLRTLASTWMRNAGVPEYWIDSEGKRHSADTPRHRFIKQLKRLGKDKGICKFADIWKLRPDNSGLSAFYMQLIDRVHGIKVSVVPDAEYLRAMYQFVLENINEYELIPDPDKDSGHRTIRVRVAALLSAYDKCVYGMKSGEKTSVELGWNDLMAKITDPRVSFWAALTRAATSGKLPYGLLVCPMQIAGCAHRFARELRSRIRNVREEYLYFPSDK